MRKTKKKRGQHQSFDVKFFDSYSVGNGNNKAVNRQS